MNIHRYIVSCFSAIVRSRTWMWHVLPCGLPSTSLKSLHEEDPSQLLLRIGDRHRRRCTADLRSDTLNTSALAFFWSGRSYANWSKFRGLVLGCIKADFFRSDIRFATFFQIYRICALLHRCRHYIFAKIGNPVAKMLANAGQILQNGAQVRPKFWPHFGRLVVNVRHILSINICDSYVRSLFYFDTLIVLIYVMF